MSRKVIVRVYYPQSAIDDINDEGNRQLVEEINLGFYGETFEVVNSSWEGYYKTSSEYDVSHIWPNRGPINLTIAKKYCTEVGNENKKDFSCNCKSLLAGHDSDCQWYVNNKYIPKND